MFDDPDGYWEPEGPEISGPVQPTRSRAVVRRLAQLIYPKTPGWFPQEEKFTRPISSGPPK